ncbi:MAG: hypothetical protein J0L82_03950 [Deltaproteobacteria bacterium]|jgi:hypothetical protein|nr:hypothetical protein [Deltaproteobacteria bacterium]
MEYFKDPATILHRELDPQVFGANPQGGASGNAQSYSGGSSSGAFGGSLGLQPPASPPQTRPGAQIPYPPIDLKVVEAQIQQIKAVLQQYERRLDQLSARQNEISRDSQSRLDRFEQQLIRLEDGISRLTTDTSQRLASLAGRVNERKVTDSKVQELMDRHNLMLRNFENRLSSMQKLASDQEQALLSAFAALEDARAELSRLKRLP